MISKCYNILTMPPPATIQLPPLTRRSMSALFAKAKSLGIKPEQYAKQLVEEGLSIQREAERFSFAQIMEPVREQAGSVDNAEIKTLVETARSRSRGARRKKR